MGPKHKTSFFTTNKQTNLVFDKTRQQLHPKLNDLLPYGHWLFYYVIDIKNWDYFIQHY